jgi:hypothetical protein
MMRLARWLAVLVVLYFGATELLPRIRNRVEGISRDKIVGQRATVDADAGACVRRAFEVNDLVVDESRNAVPPPGDSTGWVDAAPTIQQRIAEAEDACTCDTPGCGTAREALRQISATVEDLDLLIDGQERFSGHLAQRQERIVELLERARVEAR